MNESEAIKYISKFPWVEFVSASGVIILSLGTLIWWLVGKVDGLRTDFNDLVTGKTKTADGKVISIINGVQDEKLRTVEGTANKAYKLAKINSDEIREIKTAIKKYSQSNDQLNTTYQAFLEHSGELMAAVQNDRVEHKEMFSKIMSAINKKRGKP